MRVVDLHADDYAFTVNTSRQMLDLMRDGVLDSISIIPNMTCYEECIDLLKEAKDCSYLLQAEYPVMP